MKRFKIVNAIGEAIIPLLGILFWDWGLYFILLFYFIDLISAEVFTYLKVRKIISFQRLSFPFSASYGRIITNSLLCVLVIIVAHISVYFIVPNIEFFPEFISFLKYEEVGVPIPQGIILLPLVVFGNLQQYRMMFIKTGIYRVSSWKNLIISRRKVLILAIIGGLLGILLGKLFTIPELAYVLVIIGVKLYVDLFLMKRL